MNISLSIDQGLGCFAVEWQASDSRPSGTIDYSATNGTYTLTATVGAQSILVTLKKAGKVLLGEGANPLVPNRAATAQSGPTGLQYAIAFFWTGSAGVASGTFSIQ
jgi:hypothetical protein